MLVYPSKMALALSTKKKSRLPKELSCSDSILAKLLFRVPTTALLLLILVFLWSSSTTIISGNIVHVCVSSRKLNNLYCLSAGAQPQPQPQPNFEIPIPLVKVNNTSISHHHHHSNSDIKLVFNDNENENENDVVLENPKIDSPVNVTPVTTSTSTWFENSQIYTLVLPENPVHPIPIPIPIVTTKYKDEEEEEEEANAVKVVEEQLQLHRSWASNSSQATCNGRGIYVYELPPRFNKDLMAQCGDMIPWIGDFCEYFSNEALGEPIPELGKGWYRTHQYSLEPIFHSRVLKHPCRVYDENEAKLFYVPYYGGLDILRWHFKNVSNDVKDSLALDLVKWLLESQNPWARNNGKDHVFVLGKISWDFRRLVNSSWGTKFLELDQMQNPIKLLIERQPWHVNDIGIPHPTHFHPQSDNDVVAWQLKVIGSNRKSLSSFAGAARPGAPENIRSMLIRQCTDSEQCRFLNCSSGGCDQPESVIDLFMESEFCLQPPGDSPTRKSLFDSLVSGCIPVLFDPFTAYFQYPWHLPEDHGKYSVFIDQEEVREVKVNVVERLMKVPLKEREEMRRYIVYELLPGLIYGDPSSELDKFQDAFSITINNLLERVSRL